MCRSLSVASLRMKLIGASCSADCYTGPSDVFAAARRLNADGGRNVIYTICPRPNCGPHNRRSPARLLWLAKPELNLIRRRRGRAWRSTFTTTSCQSQDLRSGIRSVSASGTKSRMRSPHSDFCCTTGAAIEAIAEGP